MTRIQRPVFHLVILSVLFGTCVSASVSGEAARIEEEMKLRPGMRVADVGAGDGEWTVELARRVGERGHVFATEVDEDDLEDVRQRVEEAGLGNVTEILGDAVDTGLSAGCCDAILLRLVYHHFTDPEPMRASLRRALRPGGVIVVIDITPQEHWPDLPGVEDRGGHGISPGELIADMTTDGFELVARHDDWGDPEGEDDHFCVVFRRSGSA